MSSRGVRRGGIGSRGLRSGGMGGRGVVAEQVIRGENRKQRKL